MDASISCWSVVPASASGVAAAPFQGATSSPRRARNSALKVEPAPVTVAPLESLHLRQLRAAMQAAMSAVEAELASGWLGLPLAAERLANVVAVHLLRCVPSPQQPARSDRNGLPRTKLRAVLEYIEEYLDASPTLEQMAAVARLSPTYFASQFKRTTGLPPYRYVIGRRVDRAKQLMLTARDVSLAEVALHAGFSDQSQFSHHFKRVIGVTPGEFKRRSMEQ
jgi:AraC-like DNA-binding protein